MHAQSACLVQPPSWHDAFVPLPYYAMPTDNPRVRLAQPPLAVGREWLGIKDLAQFPELESFHFQHFASSTTDVTREALWPNNADPLFELYQWLYELAAKSGLLDPRVTFDDQDTGIFDRGCY